MPQTRELESTIQTVAKAFGWDEETTHSLGLMLWCLFRYYARRAAAETDWRKR